ncbi:hypothetical protein [Pedobacter sp. GR22-6]|uniref:hypothetical protein n=1 Tax=Pedobacter sp. GR22-6 TaxID=3127957 RepID=UPI00307F037B
MFRKIHSNRKPGVTVWSSLTEEFQVYLDKLKSRLRSLLIAYPKQAFALMIGLIIASLIFSLTGVEKPKATAAVSKRIPVIRPVENGLSQILTQADALRESVRIKEEILLMLDKDSLTAADSVHLEKAIDRLHQLTITSNPYDQN